MVVVLGERGCGKSVAFEQELARLLDDTTPATLIHLGQDVYDTATAAAHLRHHLKPEGDRTQHVLLDGLDEGLSDIRGLDKVLLTQLRALSPNERRRLRLRIACRTTRWPENLETGLRDLWPEPGQVAMVTLAALSPADAQYAVAQSGLDGAAFMEHVLSRGLQALAQQPATLIPLIRAQTEGRDLPTTVAEAFTQACRTLCTETWPQNFSQRQERPLWTISSTWPAGPRPPCSSAGAPRSPTAPATGRESCTWTPWAEITCQESTAHQGAAGMNCSTSQSPAS